MQLFRLRYLRHSLIDFQLEQNDKGFSVKSVTKVYNRGALPVPLRNVPADALAYHFEKWYEGRMISSKNPMLKRAVHILSNGHEENVKNTMAFIKGVSLLGYGRNMTDKYWVAPTKEYVFDTGISDMPMNGKVIQPKNSYLHMDYVNNGFYQKFSSDIIRKEPDLTPNYSYNFPELCTKGNCPKRIIKRNGKVYFEKFISIKDDNLRALKIWQAKEANNIAPDVFPKVEVIKNGETEIGYRTMLFTNKNTEIVTLRDICLGARDKADKESPISQEEIGLALEAYGITKDDFKNLFSAIDICREYNTNMLDNSGFVVMVQTGDVIKSIAWI